MFNKIRLGSSLAALILFAFPWLDIQCSEKSMMTQTGIETIYGGGTASEEMKSSKKNSEADPSKDSKDSVGNAPLVGLALVSVAAAVIFSLAALFQGGKFAESASSILPAVALAFLLVQLMVGFPVKNELAEATSGAGSQTTANEDDPMVSLGTSMGAVMMMNFKVKTTPAFYLELFALGIPTLLLLNGFIDKHKKN
jgi:hypothetical protein